MQEKWFELTWKAGLLSVPEILRNCKKKKSALQFLAVNILTIIIIVFHNIMKHTLKTEVQYD